MNWSGSAIVAVVDEPDIISLRWGEGVRKSESCDPTVPHPRVLAGDHLVNLTLKSRRSV